MPSTFVEKIFGAPAGSIVFHKPDLVLTHDNTGAVMKKFKAIGAQKMADPRQPVFTLDHNIQDKSRKNLEKYREKFGELEY